VLLAVAVILGVSVPDRETDCELLCVLLAVTVILGVIVPDREPVWVRD
jgi:hypothetical protein